MTRLARPLSEWSKILQSAPPAIPPGREAAEPAVVTGGGGGLQEICSVCGFFPSGICKLPFCPDREAA